jgi:polyphosphate glucokinase
MPVSNEKTAMLGIDIGGTSIKAALVDTATGKLLTPPARKATPKPATAEAMLKDLNNLMNQHNCWGTVGCRFSDVIKISLTLTVTNPDQNWNGFNPAEKMRHFTDNAVTVINDADADGMAEMTRLEFPGQPVYVMNEK